MSVGHSDAELVTRARRGDLAAFDRLVARHRARVFDIARQTSGSADAAQDIAQEAFLRAFRALDGLRDSERFGAWLNTIVRRQAQRRLREAESWPQPLDVESMRGAPVWLSWSEPEPPGEMVERVRSLLAGLSQRERQVMILHYLEGCSCQEIAARLRTSVGTVKRILHHSRRKARKEGVEMAREHSEAGPRRLTYWYDGYAPPSHNQRLRSLLTHSICLSVNRSANTSRQISQDVEAHAAYVEEAAEALREIEVLASPRKGYFLANFIALDAADWRRLVALVRQPAARVAEQMQRSQSRLRAAYEQTPLAASGWTWDRILWPMYAIILGDFAISRSQPETYRLPRPERPDGGYYILGAHEEVDDSPVWVTGFSFAQRQDLSSGWFWSWGFDRDNTGVLYQENERTAAAVLAEGPMSEQQALARLGGDVERWRGVLAHLMRATLVELADGLLRLSIPVFTAGDSDALTSVVDEIAQPIMDSTMVPALTTVEDLLDEMGYQHCREQYGQWQRWLAGNIMGEALRFMMEQGVLPRPPQPAPANFAFIAWKGDLPLMSWGVDYKMP